MRGWVILPALAFGLAACGSEPEQPENSMTEEEVAAEISELPKPLPGLYRNTTTLVDMTVPGATEADLVRIREEAKIQEGDKERCLTAEEAEKGYQDIVSGLAEAQQGMSCNFSKFAAEGSQLDAALACDAGFGTSANIAIAGTVAEESSDMTMDMKLGIPVVGDMSMKLNIKSERLGDCP